MARNAHFDTSWSHLRWGFKVAAAVVALCAAVLVAQDVFPRVAPPSSGAPAVMTPVTAAPVVLAVLPPRSLDRRGSAR